MRIVVEPSEYPELRNLGDIAMQQAALSRIARFWPSADIQAFTDAPEKFSRYAANIRPLVATGRHDWMTGFFLPLREYIHVPRVLCAWEGRIRRAHPRFFERLISTKLNLLSRRRAVAFESFLGAVRNADLLVVCGMGGVTDVFERYALDLLDTIGLVKANGKPVVAMFGQGFGPIVRGGVVAKRACEILPQVDFIALREGRASVPLLKSLGVDLSRVMVTGDDALEIAALDRRSYLGNRIGISLRIASYSQVTLKHVQELREVLRYFAELHSAPLQPLPTSLYVEEADADFIQHVTHGYDRVCLNRIDNPAALSAQLQNCRIALVGSYHAGVFALAQGVPIVCVYASDYYRDKFLGLEALFEVGIFPINLAESEWAAKLSRALNLAWENAPSARPRLIAAADKQIELGRRAYDHVREMVELRQQVLKG